MRPEPRVEGHPPEKGAIRFLSRAETQRRREVFNGGGRARLMVWKELFSRKGRKGWSWGMLHACRASLVLANAFAPPCPEWREGAALRGRVEDCFCLTRSSQRSRSFFDRINGIYRILLGTGAGGRASPRAAACRPAPGKRGAPFLSRAETQRRREGLFKPQRTQRAQSF